MDKLKDDVDKLAYYVAREYHRGVYCAVNAATKLTESPIEALFIVALIRESWASGFKLVIDGLDPHWGRIISDFGSEKTLTIIPQFKIDNFRADFKMVGDVSLIVECDGHLFHEKTKEQTSRDKARDREFTKSGLKIFRYSGSDIYNKDSECVSECLEFVFPKDWIDGQG